MIDVLGLIAAGLTLVAFAQRRMLPMRLTAITANIFFIGYGALGTYLPVLGLHLTLLPLNLLRLRERAPAEPPVTAVQVSEIADRETGRVRGAAVSQGPLTVGLRPNFAIDRYQLGHRLEGPAL